jgi:signal transduction histidine kinase
LKALAPRAWCAVSLDSSANLEALGSRPTAELRLALAFVTLLIAAGDSTANPFLLPISVAYLTYAALVLVAGGEFQRKNLMAGLARYYPVDAGVFLLFMSTADARGMFGSLFTIYLLLFAVAGAALNWGTRAGLRLMAGTVAMFVAAIPFNASVVVESAVSEILLSLGCVVGVGAIAARRGGHQFTVRSRLVLLRDAGTMANPRFGIDQTIDALLERLRGFYEAEACVLTTKGERGTDVRCVSRSDHDTKKRTRAVPRCVDLPFLPQNALAVYARPRWWSPGRARAWFGEMMNGHVVDSQVPYRRASIDALLGQTGGRSWLSVPAYANQQYVGRLHVVRMRAFNASDAQFALQVMETGMALVENIRLVDQLASSAAVRERQRVARDLHDSVVQPYVGLQLGLVAVQRILVSGDLTTAQAKVGQLVDLTGATIDELRSGIHGLKAETAHTSGNLLRALHLHATRFAEDTGIPVDIDGIDNVRCGDRLSAELFQMAVEALSNVRRHTASTHAAIRFKTDEHHVRLQVENSGCSKGRATAFIPQSLSERATALGGYVTVNRQRDGRSIVEISIPL